MQDRRHVFERANTVAPGVAGALWLIGLWLAGFTGKLYVIDGWGHVPPGDPPGLAGVSLTGRASKHQID
jgi:hypothetical protein